MRKVYGLVIRVGGAKKPTVGLRAPLPLPFIFGKYLTLRLKDEAMAREVGALLYRWVILDCDECTVLRVDQIECTSDCVP